MFKKSLAMTIIGSFIPSSIPAIISSIDEHGLDVGFVKGGKGQLRAVKPKLSGAAQLKRQAKKRNNIRKHN